MKRDIASISLNEPAGYRDPVPHSTQARTGVADDGGATGIADQEYDHRTIGIEQGPIEAMPFPGPFTQAAPPEVVDRFLESNGIAPPTAAATSAATDTPASATAPAVHADAPANGAFPAVPGNHPGQTAPPDAPERNPDGLPSLILAARLNKLDEVQILLNESAVDIDQVDSRFGSTALMFAAQAGNCDVVVLLLARGADVNLTNPRHGTTALMYASMKGHLSVVKALLNCNEISVDVARKDGLNAFALAVTKGHVDIVKALLAADANVNFREPIHEATVLMYASMKGHLPMVEALLEVRGIDVDVARKDGFNALGLASDAGHVEIVKALLAADADVNFKHAENSKTALVHAAAKGKAEVVELLLEHHRRIAKLPMADAKWALSYAAKNGYVDILELLLISCAEFNSKDPIYRTNVLRFASGKGYLSVVKALLGREGIHIDVAGEDGFNALGLASDAGHVEIVKALLAAHADVNFKHTGNSKTALMYAAAKGKDEVVRLLLEHHRRIAKLPMADARWALLYAVENRHVDIVKRLVAAGVDVNGRSDPSGKTMLITATAAGQLEMVKALLTFPGILVNEVGADGRNVLSWASESGNVDIVEHLIGAGADLSYLDASLQTNIDRAVIAGHANVVECLLRHGGPVLIGMARFTADGRHAVCLADLFLDRSTSAVSAYHPLRVFDTHWFDDPTFFFSELLTVVKQSAGEHVDAAVTSWLDSLGIRRAVIAPLMQSLGKLSEVWRLLSAEGQSSPTEQQMLAYFSGAISRLAVLAPDQQISAPYREAHLSPAGLERLSKLAIAQRNKLVALAEEMTAQYADQLLNRLVADCRVETGPTLLVARNALRNSLIREGIVAPLAGVLADSWHAAMAQLASMPLTMGQTRSMLELLKFLDESLMSDGVQLFTRNLAQRLGSADVLAEWRAMLGNTDTEGLFALFDDQCRQLRQYCEQMSSGGD